LFLEPAFKAVFALIRGLSAREAFVESQKAYLNNLILVIAKKSLKLNQTVAPQLHHDYINQVCLGDGEVHF